MSQANSPKKPSHHGTAGWSLLAALVLLVIYWGTGFVDSISEYGTGGVLERQKQGLLQPGLLWWHLGHYLLVNLVCHFLFFYLLAEVARLRDAGTVRILTMLMLWAIGLLFLHVANSAFYPHSAWSFPLAFALAIGVIAAGLLVSLLLLGAAHWIWRSWQRSRVAVIACSVLAFSLWAGSVGAHWLRASGSPSAAADKPDIILIGIDGLRPDLLAYMNTWNPQYQSPMPFLDKQLRQSVVFTQSYTSIARTYPSWMEILTGQSPMRSGIRFNLQDDYDHWQGKMATLPQYLNAAGYQTAWAIDASDFANIDHRQGFQTVMAPRMGAANFLVAYVLSDLPVVNFLSNMRIGHYLLPLTYANRSRAYGYDPDTFSRQLEDYLTGGTDQRPLFMAVHFELKHYPGGWADDGMPPDVNYLKHLELWRMHQRQTFMRLDLQVADLMKSLQATGRLDNAIVVFLSDHGNGLTAGKMGHDRFGNLVYSGDLSGGHGIDVSNLTQNHNLLAVRGFGRQALDPGYRDDLVALMDIAPTLLDRLGIAQATPMQGRKLDLAKSQPTRERVLYFQSELYWIERDAQGNLVSGENENVSDFSVMAQVYRIRPDGRMVLREKVLPWLYEMQYRAAFNGSYLVMQGPDFSLMTSREVAKLDFPTYAIDIATGEYLEPDANGFDDPGAQDLAGHFCAYYSEHAKYFVPPPFCAALATATTTAPSAVSEAVTATGTAAKETEGTQ